MFTLEWETDACFLLSRLEVHPFPGFAFSRTDAFWKQNFIQEHTNHCCLLLRSLVDIGKMQQNEPPLIMSKHAFTVKFKSHVESPIVGYWCRSGAKNSIDYFCSATFQVPFIPQNCNFPCLHGNRGKTDICMCKTIGRDSYCLLMCSLLGCLAAVA